MSSDWMRALLEDIRQRCTDDAMILQGLDRLADAVQEMPEYVYRSSELEAIAEKIFETDSNDLLAEYLNDLARIAGYRYASIMIIQFGQRTLRGARALSTFPEGWVSKYRDTNFFFSDPTINKARENSGWFKPFVQSEMNFYDPKFLMECERDRISIDTVALSLHLPDGVKGVVSFCNDLQDPYLSKRRPHFLSDIQQVCRELFFAFVDINTVDCQKEALTDNEKSFLATLIYSSCPLHALEILPQYGSNKSLQKNLMQKLGITSLFQAAAVAAKMELEEFLPPRFNKVVHLDRGMTGYELIGFCGSHDEFSGLHDPR